MRVAVIAHSEPVVVSPLLSALQELVPRIAEVEAADCPAVIGLLEGLKAQAWAKMTSPQPTALKSASHAEPVKYLTVAEVVERFKVTEAWLYRHKKKMPHSQPSRKVLLFPEAAIEKWFANWKI
jgi:hypothetical protein